jgi:hypothetical protein
MVVWVQPTAVNENLAEQRITRVLATLPTKAEREELKRNVMEHRDHIFERYIAGESMQKIAESLPFKIAGWRLRDILLDDDDTRETYGNVHIHRSHNLIEVALDYAREAAMLGDSSGLKVAIDTNMKIAAKINARDYGDKSRLELTGRDGGPVKMVALTDEQLMEIASRGTKESEGD